jgi:hypothetical protein
MDPDISAQIAQLPRFSRQQLLELWQKLYRRPAPSGIRRELMVPFLAYKIQEDAFGGLKPSTRAELRRIARSLEKSTSSIEVRVRPRIKTGTHLLRQWRGEKHEVVVTDLGFEHRGTRYRSLSEIARKIAGARWSGPAFFGVNRQAARGRQDD